MVLFWMVDCSVCGCIRWYNFDILKLIDIKQFTQYRKYTPLGDLIGVHFCGGGKALMHPRKQKALSNLQGASGFRHVTKSIKDIF